MKLTIFVFLLIFLFVSRLFAYFDGAQYLVDYNHLQPDGTLQKATVYFADLDTLKTWIKDNHDNPQHKHIWAAKIERALHYEVIEEGDGGEVVIDPLPVTKPYRVTYQVKDANGIWQFDCFYGTLEEAQARLDIISTDLDKRLFQSTPPLILGAQLKHTIQPGETTTRIIIKEE